MQESTRTIELREIRAEDTGALILLWKRVFADPEALADGFLRLLPELGGGVCALVDNELAGAAYVVTAFTVGERRAGYLYAVAVHPEYRGLGLGKAVSRAAAALGKKLGADFLCTLPASAPLYGWYGDLLGLRCALTRRKDRYAAKKGAPVCALEPEAYNARREALLRDAPHMTMSESAAAFEALSCRLSGGGLCSVGDGIAAVTRTGEDAFVRELICPDPSLRPSYAAALGAALGCAAVTLLSPGGPGDLPFLAAEPGALSADCLWNLAFD